MQNKKPEEYVAEHKGTSGKYFLSFDKKQYLHINDIQNSLNQSLNRNIDKSDPNFLSAYKESKQEDAPPYATFNRLKNIKLNGRDYDYIESFDSMSSVPLFFWEDDGKSGDVIVDDN